MGIVGINIIVFCLATTLKMINQFVYYAFHPAIMHGMMDNKSILMINTFHIVMRIVYYVLYVLSISALIGYGIKI